MNKTGVSIENFRIIHTENINRKLQNKKLRGFENGL